MRHTRLARPWLAIGVVGVLAAALGVLLAVTVTRGRDGSAPADIPTRGVQRLPDGVSLSVSDGWSRLGQSPAVPGFPPGRTTAFAPFPGLDTVVAASLLPAARPSLLPPALDQRGVVAERIRPWGESSWRYRGLVAGRWKMDAIVMPTTHGVLTIACATQRGSIPATCLDGVHDAGVRGASALVPADDLALREQLPAILAPLDRRRVTGRAALRRAATPTAQAAAADGLAATHAGAAAKLAPLAPPSGAGADVLATCRAVADRYRALARAARRRDRAGFGRAAKEVGRAERAFTAALRAMSADSAAS